MLSRIADKLEEYFLVFCLGFMVLLVFVQVVMRYIFQNSLSWSEELARYLFLWLSWIGASYAVRERGHFRVQMFIDKLDGRKREIGEALILLVWFGFCLFLAYQGWLLTAHLFLRGQMSPAMQLPIAYAYASVPVGVTLMSIRVLVEFIKLFSKKEGEKSTQESVGAAL